MSGNNSYKDDLDWCYDMLKKTSRSFAAVIQALGDEMRDAVCIFYLTLRALDSVEDDTAYPKERRIPLLREFYTKLKDEKWNLSGCGEKEDERVLLENFNRVTRIYLQFRKEYQDVICDITKRMGNGMADFIEKEVITVKDWDLYCHYVAGLVGIGLSGIFANSGLEDKRFAEWETLSNNMGLFLQKTNIIRDYREDVDQNRIFWPKEVWSKYADKIQDFTEERNSIKANHCLNELIANALQLIPDVLDYLSRIKDKNVFNFCAIPQVMAIATITLCFDNHEVFERNIKIPREETEKLIAGVAIYGMNSVYSSFNHYLNIISSKVPQSDPNRKNITDAITKAREIIEKKAPNVISAKL